MLKKEKVGWVVVFFSLFFACHKNQPRSSILSYSRDAKRTYLQGKEELEDKNCVEAEEYFKKVIKDFPYSRYAVLSKLRIADCKFITEEYIEAIALYREFIKLHPTHPEVDYAAFQIGVANYKLIPFEWFLAPSAAERDQLSTKEALRTLKEFTKKYPKSKYVSQAKQLIKKCIYKLIEHEIYVAKFYMKQGRYNAARRRFQEAMKRYPNSRLEPRIMLLLARLQIKIGKLKAAIKVYQEVIKRFPNTHYSKEARLYLRHLTKRRLK
jgi:outer membrane protein assembly factor BamD